MQKQVFVLRGFQNELRDAPEISSKWLLKCPCWRPEASQSPQGPLQSGPEGPKKLPRVIQEARKVAEAGVRVEGCPKRTPRRPWNMLKMASEVHRLAPGGIPIASRTHPGGAPDIRITAK